MILFSFFFHLCQFTQHLPLPLPVPHVLKINVLGAGSDSELASVGGARVSSFLTSIQVWLVLLVYELHFCGKALKSPCLAREPGTLPCILPASSEVLTQGSYVAGIEELSEAKSEQKKKNLPSEMG